MSDDPHGGVRDDLEVDRLTAELADKYRDISPEVIEHVVRAEFERWSHVPVHDFVPIFVARALRGKLRSVAS